MFIQGSTVLMSLAAVAQGLSIRNLDLEPNKVLRRQAAAATCLEPKALQTGSESNGQNPPVAGQVASLTDKANFINFCSGLTVTNGLQVQGGSCNGIVMGKIPSTDNMISAIIVSPKPGENLAANTDFKISVQTTGLSAGAFTSAQKTYYGAPQDLNKAGQIVGHTHVTVQDMGNSLAPTKPLDPKTFVFFKGINDAGNGQGLLSATVAGGLPAGNYRVCSMTSASNHQPVLMPVAQRGAQDDCQKFTVGGAAGNGGGNAAKGAGGKASGGKASSTAAAPPAASTAANNNGGGKNAAGGKGKGAGGKASTTVAAPPAASSAANNNGGGKKAAGGKGKGAGGKASTTAVAPPAASTAANTNGGGKKAAGGKGKGAGGKASSTTAAAPTQAPATGNTGSKPAAVAGIAAPAVTDSGNKDRPFTVNGNTFVNKSAAVQRACDIQNNACSDAVNRGTGKGATLAQCQAQQSACIAAA